jgi:hypothetical protein
MSSRLASVQAVVLYLLGARRELLPKIQGRGDHVPDSLRTSSRRIDGYASRALNLGCFAAHGSHRGSHLSRALDQASTTRARVRARSPKSAFAGHTRAAALSPWPEPRTATRSPDRSLRVPGPLSLLPRGEAAGAIFRGLKWRDHRACDGQPLLRLALAPVWKGESSTARGARSVSSAATEARDAPEADLGGRSLAEDPGLAVKRLGRQRQV